MYSLGHNRSLIIYSTAHWNITKREPSNSHDGEISIYSGDVVDAEVGVQTVQLKYVFKTATRDYTDR